MKDPNYAPMVVRGRAKTSGSLWPANSWPRVRVVRVARKLWDTELELAVAAYDKTRKG